MQGYGNLKKHFVDRRVFITGGSSGIGFDLARELVSMGSDVVIFARDRDKMAQSCRELESLKISGNQRVDYRSLDVSDNESVSRVMDETVRDFGAPDIVISNAGIPHSRLFEDTAFDEFDKVMRVNLYGTRNLVSALLPHLKKNRGQVVVMASAAGLIPMISYSAYGTSKFALVGLAECLRSELVHEGIDVSLVCPPEVDTPLLTLERETIPAEARAVKNMAGTLDPGKVARAVLRGVSKKRFLIIPGFTLKLLYCFHRMSSGKLTRFVSDKIVGLVRKKRISGAGQNG